MSANEIMEKLSAPFTIKGADGALVPAHKWRIHSIENGKAICIPYITARQVTKRLDDVLGVDKWSSNLTKEDDRTICVISVKIDDDWVDKSDVGTPSSYAKIKGETSDAIKRAAAQLGVGRYLYEMEPVRLNAIGKIATTSKGEKLISGDALSSYINTMHPLRLKLLEVYNALPNKKVHEEAFKKIWADLTK